MVSQENEYKSMAKMVLNDTIRSSSRDINEKWMSKYGLYSLMENDSILQTDTTLKAFYDSSHVANIGILHRASILLNQEPNGKTLADMTDYADTLSTLTPANKTEETWLEVLTIVNGNVLDSTGIDSIEVATLGSIAELCPYEEGFGVYMARSALLEVDTLPNFAGFNGCEASPIPPSELRREETILTSNESPNCKLYPNPTDNLLTIEYFITNPIDGKLEVFDITGKKLFTKSLPYSQSKTSIEMGNYSSGTYFVRVSGLMATSANYKVTILK